LNKIAHRGKIKDIHTFRRSTGFTRYLQIHMPSNTYTSMCAKYRVHQGLTHTYIGYTRYLQHKLNGALSIG
jgi:hypothetical protein